MPTVVNIRVKTTAEFQKWLDDLVVITLIFWLWKFHIKQQLLQIVVEVNSQIHVVQPCFWKTIPSLQIPNMYEIISNRPLIGIKDVTVKKLVCSANEIYGALEPLL